MVLDSGFGDVNYVCAGRNGCSEREGLKWRAAVFRQYKNEKPDP